MATEQWVETREAKECGNSAHVLLPKRFRGETFRVELVKPVPMLPEDAKGKIVDGKLVCVSDVIEQIAAMAVEEIGPDSAERNHRRGYNAALDDAVARLEDLAEKDGEMA